MMGMQRKTPKYRLKEVKAEIKSHLKVIKQLEAEAAKLVKKIERGG